MGFLLPPTQQKKTTVCYYKVVKKNKNKNKLVVARGVCVWGGEQLGEMGENFLFF